VRGRNKPHIIRLVGDFFDVGALPFAPFAFLTARFVGIRAAIDDARDALAEFVADFVEAREAALVFDRVMQQRGDDFVFAAAVLNDDSRNTKQVADVGLAFAFSALVQMKFRRVTKRFHKTVGEHRRFDDGLRAHQVFLSAASLGQQAEDFQVEPNERDHEAECAVPLHVLRRPALDATFDHVKIENQIQGRDDHHKEAEADSHSAAAVDRRDLNVKEAAKNHLHEIEERDTARGGNHAELEALRGTNHAGLVSEQHYEERAESEANSLNRDAWVGALEHRGNSTESQAFKERVDRRAERSPVRLVD